MCGGGGLNRERGLKYWLRGDGRIRLNRVFTVFLGGATIQYKEITIEIEIIQTSVTFDVINCLFVTYDAT